MFHLLLPISRGSCCFSDCGGAISVSAITNETIPPFPIFFSLPPSFSSLHYAGSLTLFDRMCYLQPPAAVALSLSTHRWQLNPTAACHSRAGRKMMMLPSEERVRGKKDRPQSTFVVVVVLASRVFLCVARFRHSCLPGALRSIELTLSILNYIVGCERVKFNWQQLLSFKHAECDFS